MRERERPTRCVLVESVAFNLSTVLLLLCVCGGLLLARTNFFSSFFPGNPIENAATLSQKRELFGKLAEQQLLTEATQPQVPLLLPQNLPRGGGGSRPAARKMPPETMRGHGLEDEGGKQTFDE